VWLHVLQGKNKRLKMKVSDGEAEAERRFLVSKNQNFEQIIISQQQHVDIFTRLRMSGKNERSLLQNSSNSYFGLIIIWRTLFFVGKLWLTGKCSQESGLYFQNFHF
jgi:hypothetical protein